MAFTFCQISLSIIYSFKNKLYIFTSHSLEISFYKVKNSKYIVISKKYKAQ